MKQLTLDAQAKAIAAMKTRQHAIAAHYTQIALDRKKLETEAIGNLKAKDSYTDNFLEDLNT